MAGIDKDFQGEAWAAKGAKVGYLPQEPQLDPSLDVRGNVMLGVAEKTAILQRYNDLAMNYSDETADEMAAGRSPMMPTSSFGSQCSPTIAPTPSRPRSRPSLKR